MYVVSVLFPFDTLIRLQTVVVAIVDPLVPGYVPHMGAVFGIFIVECLYLIIIIIII